MMTKTFATHGTRLICLAAYLLAGGLASGQTVRGACQ